MRGTIDVQDFINILYERGLIIIDKQEFFDSEEYKLEKMRKSVLTDEFCKISQIIKCKFFKVKSANTIKDWCRAGIIQEHEYEIRKNRVWWIRTSAITRILEEKQNGTTTD